MNDRPANAFGAVIDVDGVRVGSRHRIGAGWMSGTTAVLPPPGSTAGVVVAGGAPATRETDALAPGRLVPGADAFVLTGGSAYGLAAADGVLRFLEERAIGFPAFGRAAPEHVVPIVPTAALFDLGRGGDFSARPGAGFGYAAAAAADAAPVATGSVGAGTGALTEHGTLQGGLGTASVTDGQFTVGALVAVNAAGRIANDDGELYAASVTPRIGRPTAGESADWHARRAAAVRQGPATPSAPNTTIGVIATNAALDVAATTRLAGAAHAGIARAIRPSHTIVDGDTLFAAATGAVRLPDDRSAHLSASARWRRTPSRWRLRTQS